MAPCPFENLGRTLYYIEKSCRRHAWQRAINILYSCEHKMGNYTIFSHIMVVVCSGLRWFTCFSPFSPLIVPNSGGGLRWFVVVWGGLCEACVAHCESLTVTVTHWFTSKFDTVTHWLSLTLTVGFFVFHFPPFYTLNFECCLTVELQDKFLKTK